MTEVTCVRAVTNNNIILPKVVGGKLVVEKLQYVSVLTASTQCWAYTLIKIVKPSKDRFERELE